jgi:radical SAM superfamily enzyme
MRFPKHYGSEGFDSEAADRRADWREEQAREAQIEAELDCPNNHAKVVDGKCVTCKKWIG